MHLVTNWVFWVGVILALEGIFLLFMIARHKYYRAKSRRSQRDIRMTIRQTHNAKTLGHHSCRYDKKVWHAGECTPFACPSARSQTTTGVVLYHANR